jgi:hypothetical protein
MKGKTTDNMKEVTQLIFLLILLCQQSLGQMIVDTNKIIFSAKINALQLNNFIITDEMLFNIPIVLNDTSFFKATMLKSTGFNNVIFIKVCFVDDIFSELIKLAKFDLLNKTKIKNLFGDFYYENFVIAYSVKRDRFYKLKGFEINEFEKFYFDYSIGAFGPEKALLKNNKKFLNNYSIEGIDLDCLLLSIKSKNKTTFKEFPCLRPAYSRLMEVNNMPFSR